MTSLSLKVVSMVGFLAAKHSAIGKTSSQFLIRVAKLLRLKRCGKEREIFTYAVASCCPPPWKIHSTGVRRTVAPLSSKLESDSTSPEVRTAVTAPKKHGILKGKSKCGEYPTLFNPAFFLNEGETRLHASFEALEFLPPSLLLIRTGGRKDKDRCCVPPNENLPKISFHRQKNPPSPLSMHSE